ncbi:hypothetical protein CY34DRAFT_16592 [Suillus luteus UH-Slu-Lm8-n1]|uniref:Uncharacterized protein n=1 Tax=Suillus luteus UH-Slu-Lm8-n1 TaxID=930992 RepID=A0A0D0A361_9AGAM|nr:hypothetical protein CY34DRAFT_16592 [Suillus luteus UH-Slu-Lm8-n1]
MLPTSNAMYPGHGQRQPSRGPEPYSSNQFNPGDSSLSRPNHGLPRHDEFFSAGMGGQQDGPVIQMPVSGSFQHPNPLHSGSPEMGVVPLYLYRAAVTLHAGGTPHLGQTSTPFSGN